MSGETAKEVSGWTLDTLRFFVTKQIELIRSERISEAVLVKEILDARLAAVEMLMIELDKRQVLGLSSAKEAVALAFLSQEKMVASQLESADRAVSKAELAYEKRFDAVNEFRQTLSDQQRTLIPRAEAETMIHALAARIDELQKRAERSEGRGIGASNMWGYILAGVSVVIVMITFISGIWSKVESNTQFRQQMEQSAPRGKQ